VVITTITLHDNYGLVDKNSVSDAFVDADRDRWDAWSPEEITRLLGDVRAPWAVAAGWAIDLFLGGQRREHADLEIAVPRDRFGEVAEALADHELYVPLGDGSGRLRPLDAAGELLDTHRRGGWTSSASRPPTGSGSAAGTNVCGCRTPS
jgi:hypothetical protein